MCTSTEATPANLNSATVRRGLWIAAAIVALGIGISAFSIASGMQIL